MTQSFHVVAMGNAIVDVIAPASDAFLLEHNIAKGVMTLVDEFRARQLYEAFPAASEIAGGSAANTMAGLASFGGRGIFVGKVKDDRLGGSFVSSLEQIGVHYETGLAEGGPSTACCLIAVTPDGHRSMNTYLGASREITASDVHEAQIGAASVLYIEGYLWDTPQAKGAINKAIRAAKAAGRKVAFTLSDPFCVSRWREEFKQLMQDSIDIVFANEDEAKALFEVEDFDSALQALQDWPGVAALTRSEKGCVIANRREVHVIDAAPIAKLVDTTGAGDQFAAGFLYGMTHGRSLSDCGRLGSIAAAEVIQHLGARPDVSLADLARKTGLL